MTIIRVIDLETDGVDPPNDSVCEIGFTDIRATTNDLVGAPAGWQIVESGAMLVNPGVTMSPVGSSIHHLTDEDLRDARPWREVHPIIIPSGNEEIIAYAAHSVKAERLHVTDEMTGGKPWICTHKAALHLWPDAPRFSNQCLRYYLRPPGLSKLLATPAHRAQPDSYVTAHTLLMALEQTTVDQLIEWTSLPALLPRVPFGKPDVRGKRWSEVEAGLLYWVLDKDFDEDVLYTARYELDRREKERAQNASNLDDFNDDLPEDERPY